ncbi:MAG: hypothetical protein DPW09_45615, partial [Anaerolineae bacterium]|nr:hypothetical protein [Anaerolineae bacterium]
VMAALRQNISDMQQNLDKLATYVEQAEAVERAEDEDAPFVFHQGVTIWTCVDDDDMAAAFHYTTNLDNANIDYDEGDGTQFDVRDIPHPPEMTPAVTWKTTTSDYGSITSEDSGGREAHAALIRYAIEQGWLTQDGLKLRPDARLTGSVEGLPEGD